MLIVAEPKRARTSVVLTENWCKFPHAGKDDCGFFFILPLTPPLPSLSSLHFFHFPLSCSFCSSSLPPSPASLAWYTVILQMGSYLPFPPLHSPTCLLVLTALGCLNVLWLLCLSAFAHAILLADSYSFVLRNKLSYNNKETFNTLV